MLMDPLAARIISHARNHRSARRPSGPVLLRKPVGRRGSRPLAIYVSWLDELPGAPR
jgi:hypothetical protein